MHSTGV